MTTPLTALLTQLELAIAESTGPARERNVALLDSSHRLSHLTHQLRALARSDAQATQGGKTALDIAALLQSAASTVTTRTATEGRC